MKKTTRIMFLVVALVMVSAFVLTACNPDTPSGPIEITLSDAKIYVRPGATKTLSAQASSTDAITWSSSNEAVATVANGAVTGVSVGEATITAAIGEYSATCTVVVSYVDDGKNYTSNGYAKNMPQNWNDLDWQSANDSNILNYIQDSFFAMDYPLIDPSKGRVNADGSLNVDNLNFKEYEITYRAATNLADVTSEYGEAWGLTEEQMEDGGYIWKITLRDDLCWDDGTRIKAADFVYSMQEQLNYQFLPYRASGFWSENGMKIHNAKDYYYSGQQVLLDCTNGQGIGAGEFAGWDLDAENFGISAEVASKLTFSLDNSYVANSVVTIANNNGYSKYITANGVAWFIPAMWGGYLGIADDDDAAFDAFVATSKAMEGKTLSEILTNDDEKAVFSALLGWWCEEADEAAAGFFMSYSTYPEISFDKVGIFAASELEIVVVLDSQETWFKQDGSLNYTITNCSLPLVKKDLYEACKQEPIEGTTVWTTTYCTTVETTPSWGPYKLVEFQTGKQYTLARNDKWYVYSMPDTGDQYLTDKIVVELIETSEAIRMAFWAGQIDGVDFAELEGQAGTYQNSDFAIFSPGGSGYAYGIQLFSNLSVLKENGCNNAILGITDFRWALSLAFDRVAFNGDQLVGMELGLGLIGTDYCYDVDRGLTYRGSDAGKKALLRTYGFTENENGTWTDGHDTYADIDEATDAMSGYNLTLAKEKLALAIEELTNNAEKYNYDSTQDIILRLGKFNDKAERRKQLIQAAIDELCEGSILEGKIKVKIVEAGDNSADMFRAGKFELYCVAAIGGAILYPFNSVGSYLGLGSVTYHEYFDVSKDKLTMVMPEGDYAGAGETLTLTVDDWFYSLNGTTSKDPTYNWGTNEKCPVEVRLEILAMLEEFALKHYYSIQVAYDSSAYLNTAKSSNITDEYSLFMGLGGGRYLRYNYTDEEWAAFVASKNRDLSEYYKTAGNN